MQIPYLLLASLGTGILQNSMCIDHAFFSPVFRNGGTFQDTQFFFWQPFPDIFLLLPLVPQG